MARQFQLRGDTETNWLKADPVLADREFVLVASNEQRPRTYDQHKIGDGEHRFSELPYRGLPAVQSRGDSLTDVMSQFAVTRELKDIEKILDETGKTVEGVAGDVEKCKEVIVLLNPDKGEWHKPNTDTGTDSQRFKIHRVLLENCHSGLELRNEDDTAYEDLTLKDLYVKGRLYVDKGIVESEAEQVKTKDNWIVLNDGEVGEGVSRGTAGVKIDRGTGTPFMLLFDEKSDTLNAGFDGELKQVALVAEVLENGASVIWDDEQKMFVSGIDARCMRKDRIFVLDELPGDDEEEENAQDGDIVIVPTSEEMGDSTDFIEEFLRAIVKPICEVVMSSYKKQGDENWKDGTVVICGTSQYPTASDVVVLYQKDDEDWGELTIGEGRQIGEVAVSPELYGRIVKIKLKEVIGDDEYIYTTGKDVTIVT